LTWSQERMSPSCNMLRELNNVNCPTISWRLWIDNLVSLSVVQITFLWNWQHENGCAIVRTITNPFSSLRTVKLSLWATAID
jgi:hypothetical protein